MSTDLKKKKYTVQSARYDEESPNRSFRSFRGSKGFNDKLKDAWSEGGNGFGWTCFGWHLRLRLNHILYSNELELVDVKVIDTDISDHKPLVARFRFLNNCIVRDSLFSFFEQVIAKLADLKWWNMLEVKLKEHVVSFQKENMSAEELVRIK